MSNIQDFKSQLAGGGARPNLYKVIVPFPTFAGGSQETKKTSFLCRAASLPEGNIGPIEVPYRGRQLKIAGDRTFPEWSITLFNDTDFVAKNAFERWMNGINEHQNNIGLTPSEYQVNAEVIQLGRDGNELKKYEMVGAWPSNMSAIELAYDNNDIIEEFTIVLQYQWWESATIS